MHQHGSRVCHTGDHRHTRLALLIYGRLSEASFWIADGDQASARFRSATDALKLLLRGLLVST
ncbi:MULTISPECIES: hypothetical protein [Pseudomonas]|uniref:hypothetical protein n=1 Tax=Pseudomonas TaxID=286 RepID=UPI0033654F87